MNLRKIIKNRRQQRTGADGSHIGPEELSGRTQWTLNATVRNLQQNLETIQTGNTLMKEDLAIAKNNILQLQTENSLLRREKDELTERHSKQLEATREDVDT